MPLNILRFVLISERENMVYFYKLDIPSASKFQQLRNNTIKLYQSLSYFNQSTTTFFFINLKEKTKSHKKYNPNGRFNKQTKKNRYTISFK